MDNNPIDKFEQLLYAPQISEEDKILYAAFKEYSNECKEEFDPEKESFLWSKIKNLRSCNSLRYFLFARHYYIVEKDYNKVIVYVEKAITRFRQNIAPLIRDNESCKKNIEYTHLTIIKKKIYQIAGEVFAILGDNNLSEKYYQAYNYIQSFFKSEFDGDSVELYSYRCVNKYSLEDLINKTITVVHPSMMNDPLDSPIMLWSKEDNLESICKEKRHIKPFVKSFDYFRIRCFSMVNPNNVLMWSHYADEHKGICIKYRLSKYFIKEEENIDNRHMYLKRINYEKDIIDLRVGSIDSNLGYATKNIEWEKEKEVRLISYNPMISSKWHSIKLDDLSGIDEIYFGCRCSKEDKETIINVCKELYHGVVFYDMEIDITDIHNFKIRKL